MKRSVDGFRLKRNSIRLLPPASLLAVAAIITGNCTKLSTNDDSLMYQTNHYKTNYKKKPTSSSKSMPTVIAIDPGHGPNRRVVDSKTGLVQIESNNEPELDKVWNVAQRIKGSLRADGYKVVMLKKTPEENITFRKRAERAKQAHADMAISIHGDPGLPHTGELFPQKTGLYRGSGATKLAFHGIYTARKSQQYTADMLTARRHIEGSDIVTTVNSFDTRPGFSPGNLALVELFADGSKGIGVPWVYSEKKMPFDDAQYAKSLALGIEAALPPRHK